MPTTLNVQFFDSTKSTIVAYFASPQDSSIYANLGTVSTADAMWKSFCDAAGGAESGIPAPTAS
ncbi:hypothetical protein [Burkholderia diffusa]|uniref:hypothetical protein n=1 Tax=Burkholderia diffusa TaxID=488732 RepID=UPI00157A5F26|nr:hypothetical protein [Burkholderia diffusa]